MRKVIVNEFMTLDGVIQAPGGADEDRDGGFEHGGWQTPLLDDVAQNSIVEGMAEAGGFLLGRKTYEIFAGYWPTAPEEEAAVADPLNILPKYVASTTLTDPLAWQNSTVLRGAAATPGSRAPRVLPGWASPVLLREGDESVVRTRCRDHARMVRSRPTRAPSAERAPAPETATAR
jgi:hypothetical protein